MSLREIFEGKHYLVYLDEAMQPVVDYIMATREDADNAYKAGIRLDTLKLISKTKAAFFDPGLAKGKLHDLNFKMFMALVETIWYHGDLANWAEDLSRSLRNNDDWMYKMPESIRIGTYEHMIWMMLVSMYGDWGTSIRYGWIEKPEEAADFLDVIVAMDHYWEEDQYSNAANPLDDVPDTDRDGYGEGCRIEMIVEEEK